MVVGSTLLLRRLKKAIEKVKFLLSTNLSQWLYVGSASASAGRRLSFRDVHPGLLDIVSDSRSEDGAAAASSLGPSRGGSPAPGILSRTTSSLLWAEVPRSPSVARTASSASSSSSADPDVDRRADAFIANFWRHIQMERQVSLELRYCKSNSLNSSAASD